MEQGEGVVGDPIPDVALRMDDEEVRSLTDKWKAKWVTSRLKGELEKKQKENERYWLGKQSEDEGSRPLVDNLIFNSLEEALPVATKQNPEPSVATDDSEEGRKIASTTKKMLIYLADKLALRLKLKRAARHWAIYYLGMIKISWSMVEDEMILQVVRPQKLILDPDGTIDETLWYDGEFIGEYRQDKASDLKKRFPKKSAYIDQQTDKMGGTLLRYIEWWTDEYVCWEMDNEILGKIKNPHFRYEAKDTQTTDQFGQQQTNSIPPRNHFKVPKMPYISLEIFNLGTKAFDEISLSEQNFPLQELVNKGYRQIDKNADNMNGGMVFSLDNLTTEQAKQASTALRKGGAIGVPGDVRRAFIQTHGEPLPAQVFEHLSDARNELKNIFGTRGFGAGGLAGQKTVRGMAMLSQADSIRIGGEISDTLEQFADRIFNWMTQMIYVYWDTAHDGAVVGQAKAFEYVSLSNAQLDRKVTVSVKEGSLIPKDEMSQAKQAQELASAGLMDPITLYSYLDYPNPKEMAMNLLLWKTNPMSLFPEMQGQGGQGQPQGQQHPEQGGSPGQLPQEAPPPGQPPTGPSGMPPMPQGLPAGAPTPSISPMTSHTPNI